MKAFLTLITCLMISQGSVAQDPELFDTTWYIHKITIDNVDTFPPNSIEPIPVEETYFEEDPGFMQTGYCNYYGAEIMFDAVEDEFEIESMVELKSTCLEQANLDFTDLLIDFLMFNTNPIGEIIEYEITTSGDSKSLLLTNSLGDSVLYGDEVLGVADNEQPNMSVYPNPTADFINITIGQQRIADISIYSLTGGQVRSVSEVKNNNPIDVSTLQAGVYFVKATTHDGIQLVNKFVKQ